MNNDKISEVKNKIVKFYDDHEALIKFGVAGTVIAGICISAVICATKQSKVLKGKNGFVDAKGPDDKCAMFGRYDEFFVTYDRTKLNEIIENIKNDGCSVTKDGLDILKAVIDNPVIVDR